MGCAACAAHRILKPVICESGCYGIQKGFVLFMGREMRQEAAAVFIVVVVVVVAGVVVVVVVVVDKKQQRCS